MKQRSKKALSWLLSLAMVLGMLPGLSLSAAAADGPTVLQCEKGASDGVVYYLTRVTGSSSTRFVMGENYIFVPGSAPKPYLTKLPDGSGVLKAKSSGRAYCKSNITCYVDVVRRTAGFDGCPAGTLNYDASEYNCHAGGVKHLAGGSYTDTEYPYGSQIEVTVKKDSAGWTDARVALYQGSTKLKELTTGTSEGVYDFGYYANGTYTVFVNGERTEDIKVNAKPTSDSVGVPGEPNEYGFRYVTNLKFGPTLEYTSVGAYTTLNKDQPTASGDPKGVSDAPGALTLQSSGAVVVAGSNGVAEKVFRGTNTIAYDVVVGGTDTTHDVGHGKGTQPGIAGKGDKDVVNFYQMKVTLTADRLMESADVTLRNENGEVQKILSYDSTASSGTTAIYTGIMQEEESAQGTVSATPTTYYVYVNGQDVYQKLWRVGKDVTGTTLSNLNTSGWNSGSQPEPYETGVTFYTVSATVKKDNTAWTNATLTLDNGRDHYMLAHDDGGVYKADVLDGNDYTLTVEGVIDSNTETVKSTDKSKTLDYYTVNYYTYEKANENATSYTQVAEPYRAQIVRGGGNTSAPSDAYVQGLTFRWYSATPWASGDAYPEFDYAGTTIDEPKKLYAQFAKPEVKINEFVRTDESGNVDGSGTNFRLGNLTVSGYDVGDKAVLSAQISVKNMTLVKLLSNAGGYTVQPLEGAALSVGGSTESSVLTVTFGQGVSMAAAQEWLRASLLFTPEQGQTCEVEVTLSDRDIATATTTQNDQSQVPDGMTKLTSSMNDLVSGMYYVDSNITYNGNATGGLRIKENATVTIYVKEGATLTATGADATNGGSGTGGTVSNSNYVSGGTGSTSKGTGAGAGIYVPSNATLYLCGAGTVNATGGKGGNGGNGANGGNGGIFYNGLSLPTRVVGGSGGGGGAGGGGAGAGIGSNGGSGGTGGNGGGSSWGENDSGEGGGVGTAGTSNAAGNVYLDTSNGLTVNATGGDAGTDGTRGTGGTAKTQSYSGTSHYEGGRSIAGGGGGGGGGGKGGAGANIGAGGTGGGGGGGGGGGASGIRRNNSGYSDTANDMGGGGGGAGAGSSNNGGNGRNWNGNDIGRDAGGSAYQGHGGLGGTAGSGSSAGASLSNTSGTATYNVTFTGASSSETQTYQFGPGGTVVVPDYTAGGSDKYLLGWQVTQYGGYLGSADTHPLTSAETTIYQPGQSITLAAGTYGNITLTPILRDKVGIQATDTQTWEVPESLAETPTTYYTYTIQTTLDGESADMGPMTLKPTSGDNLTLTADTGGKYTMTVSSNNTYAITSAKYPGLGDLGTISGDGTVALAFETLTVNVEGYDPASVTLSTGGPTLTKTTTSDERLSVWRAVRKVDDAKGSFDVYVEGVKTSAYRDNAVHPASWGKANAVTISYCKTTATVSGNEQITSVELRGGTTIPLVKSGEHTYAVTRVKGTPGSYTLYVNGVKFETQTADFAANHTLTAALYRLTVNTTVDGTAADVADVKIGNVDAPRVDTGKYQLVTTSISSLAAKVGTVSIGNVADSGNYDLTAAFFTVTYKNGDTEIEDKDMGFYRAGDKVTVKDVGGAVRDGTTYNDKNSFFAGWSDGSTTYQPDATFTMPENAVILTSAWALNSTAEARWVIADKTYYGTLAEALAVANANPGLSTTKDKDGRDVPTSAKIDIYVQNPATLSADATLPANATLTVEPSKTLYEKKINAETGAEEDDTTIIGTTQGGRLTIAEGKILTNYGTVINDNDMIIEKEGVLLNKYVASDSVQVGALFTNNAPTGHKLTLNPAEGNGHPGRIINEGIVHNNGDADIPKGGIENKDTGDIEGEGPGGDLPNSPNNGPFGGLADVDEDDSPKKITLTGDVTLNDTVNFTDGDWILDLNGHTLTGPDEVTKPAIKVSGGNLTIINSKGPDKDSADATRRAGKIVGGGGTSQENQNGGKGAPGLEVAGGSVTLKDYAAVYGGTGGQGSDGKNGGTGGDGAVLSGGTLNIEQTALVQGGNGGDAILTSNSTETQGAGGQAGVSLTGENGALENKGTVGTVAEDKDGNINSKTNVTLRPGNPGNGYTYTPATIPDNPNPITNPVTTNMTPGPIATSTNTTEPVITAVTGADLIYGYAADSGKVTVTVTKEPLHTYSYQWYSVATETSTGGTKINGATEASYSFPTGRNAGTYYYYCVVTAAHATGSEPKTATSSAAAVNVAKADWTKTTASGSTTAGSERTISLASNVAPGGALGAVTVARGDAILDDTPTLAGSSLTFKFKADAPLNSTATLTIPVTNATNHNNYTITVTLTVDYALEITAPTFAEVTYGYEQPAAQTISIKSMAASGTTEAKVALTGAGADDFIFTGSDVTIAAGTPNTTCTVRPKDGLNAGTHTAMILVTYHEGETAKASVSFKVKPARYEKPADNTVRTGQTTENFTVTVAGANITGMETKKLEYAVIRSADAGSYFIPASDSDTNSGNKPTLPFKAVPTLKDGKFKLEGLARAVEYTVYFRWRGSADGNYLESFTSSVTFTEPREYSVSYNANYGTGTVPATKTGFEGVSTVTVASGAGLTRKGYTFTAWNEKPDGTGTAHEPDSTVENGMTLYAQWIKNTYTLKLDPLGGTVSETEKTLTYDGEAYTLPTPTRDDYAFAGWSLKSNGSGANYVGGQKVKNLTAENDGTVTLYAVWTQDAYTVTVNVHSDYDNPVKLELKQGETVLKHDTTTMSEDSTTGRVRVYHGTYVFTDVTPGVYNIVATQKDNGDNPVTMTISVVVTDANVAQRIIMPNGNTNSVLKVEGEDTPAVVAGNLEKEAERREETNKIVTITMTVERQEEQQLPENASEEDKQTQEAIAEIKEQAARNVPGRKPVITYLNIDVEKTTQPIGGGTVETETLKDTAEVIEIVIPFDLDGIRQVWMYRQHNGETRELDEADTKLDGTFLLDRENNLIFLYANKFSTYAIVYATASPMPGGGGDGTPTYPPVITPTPHGGVEVNPQEPQEGDPVIITPKPDEGYTPDEIIVTGPNGETIPVTKSDDGTYTFTQPDGPVTITVRFVWKDFHDCPKDESCPIWPYTDAKTTAWYHDGVHFCLERGYMVGYGNGMFGPNDSTTRAMMAQILYNMEGRPAVNYALSYTDVGSSKWYTNAVRWATANNIMVGYGDGNFGPGDSITREQLVTTIHNYAKYKGVDVSEGEDTNILSYDDAPEVSGWANAAMQWAVGAGVVVGRTATTLNPKATATRAEIATIIMRYCTEVAE